MKAIGSHKQQHYEELFVEYSTAVTKAKFFTAILRVLQQLVQFAPRQPRICCKSQRYQHTLKEKKKHYTYKYWW